MPEDPRGAHNYFDIVLFDLGSTLIYFNGDWQEVMEDSIKVLTSTLQINGFNLIEKQFIEAFNERLHAYNIERDREYCEYTTEYVLRSLLEEFNYHDLPKERLRPAINAMYAVSEKHWCLDSDTLPTLVSLKRQGYHIGLISNAADAQDVENLIDQSNLRAYLELVLVSADVGIRKPHPHIFQLALDHWEAQTSQAVMVGDTLSADILGARKAGIASVWITRWAGTPDNRINEDAIIPDALINTLSELPDLLSHWKFN